MIERLNFYDVYGYLLPGLTLLGVFWFPLWFITGHDLPTAWSSAFVVLVLGYVAGHALGRVSGLAFPHGRVLPGTPAASANSAISDHRSDNAISQGSGAVANGAAPRPAALLLSELPPVKIEVSPCDRNSTA